MIEATETAPRVFHSYDAIPKCASGKQIAEMLGISQRYVNQMANDGKFGDAAFRVGRVWRFNTAKIMAMYNLD